MRKSWKYLSMGIAGFIFLVLFSFARFPQQTVRTISYLKKTLKEVILKDKKTFGYDAVTSASLRVDEEKLTFSRDKS